jgi:hypothetical protein
MERGVKEASSMKIKEASSMKIKVQVVIESESGSQEAEEAIAIIRTWRAAS